MDMLDLLARETAQVERLVRDADLAAAVAACPGWTAYDLVTHLGAIHRWAAAATRTPPDGVERCTRPASVRRKPQASM